MNMKVIVAAGCFLAGTGAGTTVAVKRSAAAHAAMPADSLAADSTHSTVPAEPGTESSHETADGPAAGHAPADSANKTGSAAAKPAEPPATSSGNAAAAATPAVVSQTADKSGAAPPPAPQRGATADTAVSVNDAPERLARILAAMKPEEAAKILEPLEDGPIHDVLTAMPERKAAAILARFTGERAAALARALLQRGTDTTD